MRLVQDIARALDGRRRAGHSRGRSPHHRPYGADMTPTERGRNTEIVVRAYQLLDRGDLDALRTIYADDVEMITPDEHIRGIEAALSLLQGIRTAFPDLRHELVTVIEDGDAVASEWRVTGTHAGALAGPDGEIPPTGRRVHIMLAEFARVIDGRIARSVSYWDKRGLRLATRPSCSSGYPSG
jgi:steroid delta-isomerase-like uncharacterized protein